MTDFTYVSLLILVVLDILFLVGELAESSIAAILLLGVNSWLFCSPDDLESLTTRSRSSSLMTHNWQKFLMQLSCLKIKSDEFFRWSIRL